MSQVPHGSATTTHIVLSKLHICGHLNQLQSSRRLEREAGRNVVLM